MKKIRRSIKKRIKKQAIPSVITGCNIIFGFMGIFAVIFLYNQAVPYPTIVVTGLFFVIGGALCDTLDGYIARKIQCTSLLGEELDSLADLVTFGVLPGILAFLNDMNHSLAFFVLWSVFISTVYVISSSVRLARYNATKGSESEQYDTFQGLPMPVAAIFLTSWLYIDTLFKLQLVSAVLPLVIGILMLSTIPFPHLFKRKHTRRRYVSFSIFLACCFVFSLMAKIHWSVSILMLCALLSTIYVGSGVMKAANTKRKQIKEKLSAS